MVTFHGDWKTDGPVSDKPESDGTGKVKKKNSMLEYVLQFTEFFNKSYLFL